MDTSTGTGTKVGVVGSFGSAAEVLDMAVAAEEHGWDGFFSWDGIAPGTGEYWDEANADASAMSVFDPWTVLAAAAVKTSRVTLGAMIFPLSRRRPWNPRDTKLIAPFSSLAQPCAKRVADLRAC